MDIDYRKNITMDKNLDCSSINSRNYYKNGELHQSRDNVGQINLIQLMMMNSGQLSDGASVSPYAPLSHHGSGMGNMFWTLHSDIGSPILPPLFTNAI